ncbi:MAG: hypothetical protein RJB38_1187 [Pseudomonadota bacterium]
MSCSLLGKKKPQNADDLSDLADFAAEGSLGATLADVAPSPSPSPTAPAGFAGVSTEEIGASKVEAAIAQGGAVRSDQDLTEPTPLSDAPKLGVSEGIVPSDSDSSRVAAINPNEWQQDSSQKEFSKKPASISRAPASITAETRPPVSVAREAFQRQGKWMNAYYFVRQEKDWVEVANQIYRDPIRSEDLMRWNRDVKVAPGALVYYMSPIRASQDHEMQPAYQDFGLQAEPYRVKRGDTLSEIAKRRWGSYLSYVEILDANRGLVNPRHLQPGAELMLPPVELQNQEKIEALAQAELEEQRKQRPSGPEGGAFREGEAGDPRLAQAATPGQGAAASAPEATDGASRDPAATSGAVEPNGSTGSVTADSPSQTQTASAASAGSQGAGTSASPSVTSGAPANEGSGAGASSGADSSTAPDAGSNVAGEAEVEPSLKSKVVDALMMLPIRPELLVAAGSLAVVVIIYLRRRSGGSS